MTELPTISLPKSRYFPSPTSAGPDGLVYFGGRLSPDWLLDAYSHGIFPWPFSENDTLLAWWTPDPRAIFELTAGPGSLHVSRRLRRTLRSSQWTATCDTNFRGVITGCATAQDRHGQTWLGPAMIKAYCEMHEMGHAHSVEVWHEGELAGGVYGLAIGGLFSAESMFYAVRDASKVALAYLVSHLRTRGFTLLDIQQLTEHTERLGACEISRDEYLARLALAVRQPVTFGDRLEGKIRKM
ncbi:MAG: leucyl/phenylalanyl-tRNA--protein transferase [Planctomycetia bacterium]|nr:leucyl/phenylalanyl-tRNA--protein transferase [Planctomycetia bacterium]